MIPPPARPLFTRDGCLLGARLILPVVPGVVAFGIDYGAEALQKGLSLWETLAMSAFVYSGAAQMVALEIWRDAWSPGALLGLMLVTATVGARMILMGASLRSWLVGSPRLTTAANLFMLTDANWLMGIRYRTEGGRDVGVLFGAGLMLWIVWMLSALPGYFAGALIDDPRRYGLDLVLPVYFAAMLVPLWKGGRSAAPWLVAAAVSLAVQALIPGYTYILAGALAGAVMGGVVRGRA